MKLDGLDSYRDQFDSVPGWMHLRDLELFDAILAHQLADDIRGGLLEIGTYKGKSAIALGFGLRPAENLHVNDLFGTDAPDHVSPEGMDAYDGLAVKDFEHNYARWHSKPSIVHVGPSTKLHRVLADDDLEFRFIHVDGGHAYKEALHDLDLAHDYLGPRGVVAVDDYRTHHTPGVSAAVWEMVYREELYPFALSEVKLYATTSLPDYYHWARVCKGFGQHEEHLIFDLPVYRFERRYP